jgi:predicted RNA-binding Zn ribbon-like protein
MDDEELAAPGELEHLRQFVNTRDLELGTDTLRARFDPPDLDRALELREAFRALLLSNATGEPPPPAALETVEHIGRRATLRVNGELRLVEATAGRRAGERTVGDPLRGARAEGELARLLAIAAIARADGTWQRLKACPGDACQWALYDRTRSRTRRWCTATKCGARTRSRDYRRRRAGR